MPDVTPILYSCMKQTNEIMQEPHWTDFTPQTGIMNHETGEVLDSVDFVVFLILVEDTVFKKLNRNIKILGSGMFTRKEHPFKTVATLAEYVQGLL